MIQAGSIYKVVTGFGRLTSLAVYGADQLIVCFYESKKIDKFLVLKCRIVCVYVFFCVWMRVCMYGVMFNLVSSRWVLVLVVMIYTKGCGFHKRKKYYVWYRFAV